MQNKTLLLVLFLFSFSTALSSQEAMDDPSVKINLTYHVKELHENKVYQTNPSEYNQIIEQYDNLVEEFNEVYADAAQKVAKLPIITSAKKITRKNRSIKRKLNRLEEDAIELNDEAVNLLNKSLNRNIYQSGLGSGVNFLAIWNVVTFLFEQMQDNACREAKDFYLENKWEPFEYLIRDKEERVNFRVILDNACE